MEHGLVGLASVLVLGVGAQWLSWRLHLPAILMLLVLGFLAGPVLGVVRPDELFGELLFPIVSLSVAIILFEGGLSLDIAELRGIGRVVRNLIGVGMLVTWTAAALLAYLVLDFEPVLAILFGALLTVTGPTVMIPMLRQIRPHGRVGSASKWEGIVNDPLGAILAVLVLEAILAGGLEAGLVTTAWSMLEAGVIGSLIGLAGAAAIVVLLRYYLVPDFLQSPVALTIVLGSFALSNHIQAESGLLAVTVMGIALASQRMVSMQAIVAFKENLRVLLISTLFILLAARLPLNDPVYSHPASYVFVGALILVVRPLAVTLATFGSTFNWKERVFLGLMAPRGIVAAAVASLFALRLTESTQIAVSEFVSMTFMVIAGTVAVYGIAAPLTARLLGLSSPNPQGLVIVGAAPWVRELARTLSDLKVPVVLIDSNWVNVTAARRDGIKTYYLNALTETATDEVDLAGIGRLLALTPNDEVNALAAVHFGEVLGRAHVFQLPLGDQPSGRRRDQIPEHLRGRWLFREDATYEMLADRFARGAAIKRNRLTEELDFAAYRERYGESALQLFVIRESGDVEIVTAEKSPAPKPGQTVVSLVGPSVADDSRSKPQ